MKNVIRLDDHRQPRRPPREPRVPDAPRFFCLNCDTDQFKLYASGTVHCATCGALIRNVEVSNLQEKRR